MTVIPAAYVCLLLMSLCVWGQDCPPPDSNCQDFEPDSDEVRKGNSAIRDTLPIQIAPLYGRSCEPCPPTVHYLHRFYRHCYVIYPYKQWIRYVTCPSKCNEPCWCSNTRCVPTRYIRVWLWAWCVGSDLPGGYKFGLNWCWLWLPEDCQCRELNFLG